MGTFVRICSMVSILVLPTLISYGRSGDQFNPGSPAQIELMQKALDKYREIQKSGGWIIISGNKKTYQQGQTDAGIKQIKERLRTTGDLGSTDTSMLFTEELTAAVKKIQKRFGFKENGVVDLPLIKELNIPVEVRIKQLEINMERLQNTLTPSAGTRLVANIPEFKLHVYEGEQPVFDIDIVVGSESNKTVIFSDEMTHIVFSPYWNVPESIVKNEILPAMRKNRAYLRRNNYEQTGTENGLPVIRQKPGPKNSLGQVKFVFPNNHGIYFHDTPAKGLFELRKRTFSHGCIRLAEPGKLAKYLLRNSSEWNDNKISEAMNSGKEQWVKLPMPVAVSLTYFTAWVDKDGQVCFREDVYGYDKSDTKTARNAP
jgi:murein L,D-transpeptidase YcbB/YkuD